MEVSKTVRSLFVVSFCLVLAAPAQAEGPYEKFDDRFKIYLGGFYPSVDSKITINPAPPTVRMIHLSLTPAFELVARAVSVDRIL